MTMTAEGLTTEITPAERAILDRLSCHPDSHRWIGRPIHFRLCTHRYYLAYSPAGAGAVLRLKDEEGVNEWKARRWWNTELFPDLNPTITDVTLGVLDAIETSLELSRDEFNRAKAWVLVEEGCRFLITDRLAPPPTPDARPLHPPNARVEYALCPEIPRRPVCTSGR